MDITELTVFQHFYWPGIRYSIQREVTNGDACQQKKWSNKKYGKLPTKEAKKTIWNKLCVYLIGPYITIRKGQKEKLNLKDVTPIDTVTEWFKITQYDEKIAISITNLVETMWLTRYPIPM